MSRMYLWHCVLQCVAVCCSVLQCVAVCCSVLQCVAVSCSVLQCVAMCYGVLQCVAILRVSWYIRLSHVTYYCRGHHETRLPHESWHITLSHGTYHDYILPNMYKHVLRHGITWSYLWHGPGQYCWGPHETRLLHESWHISLSHGTCNDICITS